MRSPFACECFYVECCHAYGQSDFQTPNDVAGCSLQEFGQSNERRFVKDGKLVIPLTQINQGVL